MNSYYDYQNSLNQYTNLLDAYNDTASNQLSSNQLKDLNKQMKEQVSQSIGIGVGIPLSLSVAKAFLKTRGTKALVRALGKKLGMNDEDIEALVKDPKQGMADLIERYGSKKINQLLGRHKPTATTEEEEPTLSIEDEPLDVETFGVDFPLGHIQQTRTFQGGLTNLVESHFEPREEVAGENDLFDAQEEFGEDTGDLLEESNAPISHEVVHTPQQEGMEMRDISDVGADVGDVGEEVAETTAGVAGDIAGDVAGGVAGETAIEGIGGILDATPLAPLGIFLGILGAIFSFLPFFGGHHHHPKPPPPPNFSLPTPQFGT